MTDTPTSRTCYTTKRYAKVHGTRLGCFGDRLLTGCGRATLTVFERDFIEYATTYPSLCCAVCRKSLFRAAVGEQA